MEPLLEVKNLRTSIKTKQGYRHAVQDVSFQLNRGEILGIVGESGCGKSMTALSILKLVSSPPVYITGGEILYDGRDLLKLDKKEMRKIRGNRISMIFQEPMTSLNPVYTVGKQIMEAIVLHQQAEKKQAFERAVETLRLVGIPSPEQRMREYPHQLSGGMRQRVMIAMALSCRPELLIADEPTTALDVTIQAQILDELRRLQRQFGTSIMMITHDLGVVAEMARRVLVMYAGQVVEYGAVEEIFRNPLHPYTRGLLESIPRLDQTVEKLHVIKGMVPGLNEMPKGCRFCPRCAQAMEICREKEPDLFVYGGQKARCWLYKEGKADLLEIRNLKKYFPITRGLFKHTVGYVKAVDGINLKIKRGETLGLVGESGCGKSTLGRSILRLTEPSDGEILLDGTDIRKLNQEELRQYRKKLQIIFQDPFASLNPRMTVGDIVGEPLKIHGLVKKDEMEERVAELLTLVGLDSRIMGRYPHQFSGGQRQRIGIARALSLNPELVICDEPVSALDVSVRSQVLNLMNELKEKLNLTFLFISHDLSVVKHISDRVAVMYLGQLVELADKEEIYENPTHPYTKALMSAIPIPDPFVERKRIILAGDVPSPLNPPSGCRFHPRCPLACQVCREQEPKLREYKKGHYAACHRAGGKQEESI